MKKILLASAAAVLFCMLAIGQKTKTAPANKNYIILTAGPAFPQGDFGSRDLLTNSEAGAANTGFSVDLRYGHHFNRIFGVSVLGIYSRLPVDKSVVADNGNLKVKPWRYAGIMVGPMATGTLSSKSFIDFSILSGIVSARTPRALYNGEVLLEKDWSPAVPVRVSADFRYLMAPNAYFLIGGNYSYINPEFNTSISDASTGELTPFKFRQKMNIIGVNAGFGYRF